MDCKFYQDAKTGAVETRLSILLEANLKEFDMNKEKTSSIYVSYIAAPAEKVFETIIKLKSLAVTGAMRMSRSGRPARLGSTCAPARCAPWSSSARSSRS